MRTAVIWKDGMEFDGVVDQHVVRMDAKAPIGKNAAASPKDLVAMGLGGCTAMDVIALLKKYKQPPTQFRVDVDIQPSVGNHPIVFANIVLNYVVEGSIEESKLIEAVTLSQTKYCGVSAMLSQAVPIEYHIFLNDTEVAKGFSNFK